VSVTLYCIKHPKYKGLKEPKVKYEPDKCFCWDLWDIVNHPYGGLRVKREK